MQMGFKLDPGARCYAALPPAPFLFPSSRTKTHLCPALQKHAALLDWVPAIAKHTLIAIAGVGGGKGSAASMVQTWQH